MFESFKHKLISSLKFVKINSLLTLIYVIIVYIPQDLKAILLMTRNVHELEE
jgi:hypothetical protein